MTVFGLVRHGQTDYNLRGLFQGSSDIPLNDTGRDQAHHALEGMEQIAWDGVITSPLSRAAETGRIIAEDHSLPMLGTDDRLVEIDWGAAEGHDVHEMEERYPGRSFPGREDLADVADRAAEALEDLAEEHPGKNILVVAHGTLIRLLLSGVTGEHLPSIPNGTLSLIEVDGDRWEVTMAGGTPREGASMTVPRKLAPRFALETHHLRPQGLAPRD